LVFVDFVVRFSESFFQPPNKKKNSLNYFISKTTVFLPQLKVYISQF